MERLLNFFVRRIAVEGHSMEPTYQPGQLLTAVRRWRQVRAGDVVVMRDPRDASRWMLKRCLRRVGTMADVRGDNENASTDSRDFGLVPVRQIRYLVVTAK